MIFSARLAKGGLSSPPCRPFTFLPTVAARISIYLPILGSDLFFQSLLSRVDFVSRTGTTLVSRCFL
jgi:hypothetical protein